MAKNSYNVNYREAGRVDASFKLCFCTLCFFMVLFSAILLLMTLQPWKKEKEIEKSQRYSDGLKRDIIELNTQSTILNEIEEPTTLPTVVNKSDTESTTLNEIEEPATLPTVVNKSDTESTTLNEIEEPSTLSTVVNKVDTESTTLNEIEEPTTLPTVVNKSDTESTTLNEIEEPSTLSTDVNKSDTESTTLNEIEEPSTLSTVVNKVDTESTTLNEIEEPATLSTDVNKLDTESTTLNEIEEPSTLSTVVNKVDTESTTLNEIEEPSTLPTDVIKSDTESTTLNEIEEPSTLSTVVNKVDTESTTLNEIEEPATLSTDVNKSDTESTTLNEIEEPSTLSTDVNKSDTESTTLNEIEEPSTLSTVVNKVDTESTTLNEIEEPSTLPTDVIKSDTESTTLNEIEEPSTLSTVVNKVDTESTTLNEIEEPATLSTDVNKSDTESTTLNEIEEPSTLSTDVNKSDTESTTLNEIEEPATLSTDVNKLDTESTTLNEIEEPSTLSTDVNKVDTESTTLNEIEEPSTLSTVVNKVDTESTTLNEIEEPATLPPDENKVDTESTTLNEIEEPSTLPPDVYEPGESMTINKNYCNTLPCGSFQSRILSLLHNASNYDLNCNQFYNDVCGGLRSQKVAEEDATAYVWTRIRGQMESPSDTKKNYVKAFKTFYDSCDNFYKDFDKSDTMEQIKGIITNTFFEYQKAGDLTELFVKLIKKHNSLLFDVVLELDKFSSDMKLISTLSPPNLKNILVAADSDNEYKRFSREKKEDIYHATSYCDITYLNKIYTKWEELVNKKDDYLIETLYKLFTLSDNVTEIVDAVKSFTRDERKLTQELHNNIYTPKTIDQLNEMWNTPVNWKNLFKEMIVDVKNYDNIQYTDNFEKVMNILKNKNLQDISYALKGKYAYDLYNQFGHTPKNREDFCLKVASGLMEDASSAIYLNSFKKEELESMNNLALDVFSDLKDTTIMHLKDMPQEFENKDIFINKANNLNLFVLSDIDTFLREVEEEFVHVQISDNFINNVQILQDRYRRLMYQNHNKLGKDVIWQHFMLPYHTKAKQIFELDVIVVPFGLLDSLEYLIDLPEYVRVARLGHILGHEIGKYLDESKMYTSFKTNGPENNFVSFIEKTNERCEGDYGYRTLTFDIDGCKANDIGLDNNLTIPECKADAMALKLALDTVIRKRNSAVEEGFPRLEDWSMEKLFFIVLGQSFCTKQTIVEQSTTQFNEASLPNGVRLTEMLKNSEKFNTVFHCASAKSIPTTTEPDEVVSS